MGAVQVTRTALSTAGSGTQDITISGFGTPTGAMFICTSATTNGIATSGVDTTFSVGFTDGTNSRCMAMSSQDAAVASNTARMHSNAVIAAPDVGGAIIDLQFDFNSFITDGVRLTITTPAAEAYLCTVILFKDTDGLHVNHLSLGTGTAPIDVTSPGFEPDLVLMTCTGANTWPTVTQQSLLAIGCSVNDGLDTNRYMAHVLRDDIPTSEVANIVGSSGTTGQLFNDALTWRASIGGYDANGFSITPNSSAGSDFVCYIALKFTDVIGVSLFDVDIPNTGNYVETAPNFLPAFGLIALTTGATVRDVVASSGTGGFSLTAFDVNNLYSSCLSEEDANLTMNSSNYANTNLSALTSAGGVTQVESDGYSLEPTGWDFSLTNSSTTLGWGLAIEEIGTPPVLYNRPAIAYHRRQFNRG